MAHYRLYFLNAFSGHFERSIDIEAPDDAAALALAQEHEGPLPLELWTGTRKVHRMEASESAPFGLRPISSARG